MGHETGPERPDLSRRHEGLQGSQTVPYRFTDEPFLVTSSLECRGSALPSVTSFPTEGRDLGREGPDPTETVGGRWRAAGNGRKDPVAHLRPRDVPTHT